MNIRFIPSNKLFLYAVLTISMASLITLFYLLGLAKEEFHETQKSSLQRSLLISFNAQNSLNWPLPNRIQEDKNGIELLSPVVEIEARMQQKNHIESIPVIAVSSHFFTQLNQRPPSSESFIVLGSEISKRIHGDDPFFLNGVEFKTRQHLPPLNINLPLMIDHSIIMDLKSASLIQRPISPSHLFVTHKMGIAPKSVEVAIKKQLKPYLNHDALSITQASSDQHILLRLQKHMKVILWVIATLGTLISGITLNHIMLLRLRARKQEFGIRLALGATSSQIIHMVVQETTPVMLLSMLTATGLSVAMIWFLSSFNHWPIYLGYQSFAMGLLLPLLTGTLFSGIPAWRLHRQWPDDLLH